MPEIYYDVTDAPDNLTEKTARFVARANCVDGVRRYAEGQYGGNTHHSRWDGRLASPRPAVGATKDKRRLLRAGEPPDDPRHRALPDAFPPAPRELVLLFHDQRRSGIRSDAVAPPGCKRVHLI